MVRRSGAGTKQRLKDMQVTEQSPSASSTPTSKQRPAPALRRKRRSSQTLSAKAECPAVDRQSLQPSTPPAKKHHSADTADALQSTLDDRLLNGSEPPRPLLYLKATKLRAWANNCLLRLEPRRQALAHSYATHARLAEILEKTEASYSSFHDIIRRIDDGKPRLH